MGCVFASRVAEGSGTTFRASLFGGETISHRCWLYCMFRVTACSRLPTGLHRYPLSRPCEYPTGMFTLYTPCTRPVQGPIPGQGKIFGPTGCLPYRATAYATPVRGSAL